MGVMGAGLTRKEIHEMELMLNTVEEDRYSDEAMKIRDEIFMGKKQIARVRYWFDSVPGIQLREEEIDAIIKRYADWSIVRSVLNTQMSLTNDKAVELVRAVSKINWTSFGTTIISTSKITDDDLKMEVVEALISSGNWNHYRSLLAVMDREIATSKQTIWNKLYHRIIDEINSGSKRGESLLESWLGEDHNGLDIYAIDQGGIECMPLYDATNKMQYISKELKELFVF